MTKGGKFLGPITGKTQHAWNKITTVTSRGFIRGEAQRRRNTMFNRSHPPTGGEEPAACLQTSDTVFQQKHRAAHEPARISPIKSSICTIDRRPALGGGGGSRRKRAEEREADSCESIDGDLRWLLACCRKINTAKRRSGRRRTDHLSSPAH